MTEVEIPKQCKAGVVVNEGPDFRIEVQMVDVPEPKDDEVLLKLNCTGLCMSDVHFMLNDWAVPPMSTFNCKCAGHEGAGEVVKVGKNVTNWKIGDRGGVKPIWDVCHNCEQCWNGRENYCPNAAYTGLVATGTYQQYITSPARYTSRIPEGVSDEVAAPIMCSASTMHRALWDSGLRAGNFVVFPGGGGGVGIQGVQLAKAMGMRPVVVDSGAAKKDLSFKMGAEAFVDFKEHEDVAAKVKEVCDGVGAHGVLVTAYQSYKDAISFIADRIGGKIMCIALPPAGAINLGSDPNLFIFKNMSIIGTLVGTMQDTAACLDYARRGLLKQISELRPMSAMPESVQQLRRGEIAVDSDGSSVHTTPSLRGHAHDNVPGKTDVDSHFRLEREAEADRPEESSAAAESPPPFSSHNFPSRYFPAPSPADPYKALVTGCETSSALPAPAPQDHPSAPAPPFEEEERPTSESSVVAETKAALPPDTKEGRSSKDLDDGEPPPPYTEGSSPLDGFTYIMAAAGGAASVITQVQQGGPAPINTALGAADENITLELRGTRFTLSRDELLTLPEFVLLSLFPNGLLPDGHMNSYHDGDVYPVDVSQPRIVTQVTALPTVTAAQVTKVLNNQDVYLSDTIFQSQYDPTSLQYMLEFFRHVAQTIPQGDDAHSQSDQDLSQPSQTMPIEPMPGNARDMLQDRAGIIVLREDLDFYAIPPRRDIEQPEMIEVKRAAGKALLHQDGIFSGLRKSEEPGTTEQHLIEMLTAGGFDHADTWGHRAAEPNKAVICSIALARLRTDIRGEAANSNAVGMAQKLLLFWRKPARRCWWEGIELDNVEGVEGKLKVWIRRVWTLEMVSLPQKPNLYG
ncbi:alcohol dehydrogenase [Hortaea werneckii]|nr:alcohol dehydrogenase [Hortaea werneckii]